MAKNRAVDQLEENLKIGGASIRYVEKKRPNMDAVTELLELSEESNHWTNFGPVSYRLENEIARILKLADHLSVVMCASGTAAMHSIISLQETLAERRLRWVTSSFSFYTTVQGPLSEASIADVDNNAMLDIDQLDPNTFDGFIVTNVFGQEADLTKYTSYAEKHGKVICVDAATALTSHTHGANECISFHHTKPWGFGEGGCAIISKEHESLFRSIISFGHQPGEPINRFANNGKISDIASAFSLVRLQEMETKSAEYLSQYQRISTIGKKVGFSILADKDEHPGTPANVPFLGPRPFANFKHPLLPSGRYYHPLGNTPKAREIYSRIINIPCHSDLATVSDNDISEALESIIVRCHE